MISGVGGGGIRNLSPALFHLIMLVWPVIVILLATCLSSSKTVHAQVPRELMPLIQDFTAFEDILQTLLTNNKIKLHDSNMIDRPTKGAGVMGSNSKTMTRRRNVHSAMDRAMIDDLSLLSSGILEQQQQQQHDRQRRDSGSNGHRSHEQEILRQISGLDAESFNDIDIPLCKPRPTIESARDYIDLISTQWILPTCVEVHRCGGCCFNEEYMTCEPTSVQLVNKTILLFENVNSDNVSEVFARQIEILNHTECGCGCDIQDCSTDLHYVNHADCTCSCRNQPVCPDPGQYFDNYTCGCKCLQVCTARQYLDSDSCSCQCLPDYHDSCDTNYYLDEENDCQCICNESISSQCSVEEQWDSSQCKCVCSSQTQCTELQTLNSETCQCQCTTTQHEQCTGNKQLHKDTCLCECEEDLNCSSDHWNPTTCTCDEDDFNNDFFGHALFI